MKEMIEKKKFEEHLHYLRVLQKTYVGYQPEIRDAIDFAIRILEKKIGDLKMNKEKTNSEKEVLQTSEIPIKRDEPSMDASKGKNEVVVRPHFGRESSSEKTVKCKLCGKEISKNHDIAIMHIIQHKEGRDKLFAVIEKFMTW